MSNQSPLSPATYLDTSLARVVTGRKSFWFSMCFDNLCVEGVSPVSTKHKGLMQSSCLINDLHAPMVWHSECFSEYCEGEKTEGNSIRPVRKREGEGMKSALQFHSNQFRLTEEDTYATTDDFQKLFAREMTDLFRLSLILTADAEKAESCLILAMRECFANSNVSRGWALIWARRTVIRNAIRLVLETENAMPNDICSEAGPDFHLQSSEYRIEALRESPAILELPSFDRLAFVICVLEQYSILDCALLLKRSPKAVNDARVRAINLVVSAEERNRHDSTKHFQPACTARAALE
jgi:DNA-directed RNA polymerase specialized sigma24 family protein